MKKLGLVRSRSLGRKRVALNHACIAFASDGGCIPTTPPLKKPCFDSSISSSLKSAVEDLPRDVLIRILCGVDHDDLRNLFFVSKTIRTAVLVAKQSHFAYSTPQKTSANHKSRDFVDDFNHETEEEEAPPNAPKQMRIRRFRLNMKKLAGISVSLFSSNDDICWPQRN